MATDSDSNELQDLYQLWLDIPPEQQPADHYRLLGIDLFETDRGVIDAAARRQLAHLRSKATKQNLEFAQKIFNKIAAARKCLLTPELQRHYDAKLQVTPAPPVQPPSPPTNGATSTTAPPIVESPARKPIIWITSGTVAILLIGIAVGLSLSSGPNDPVEAANADSSAIELDSEKDLSESPPTPKSTSATEKPSGAKLNPSPTLTAVGNPEANAHTSEKSPATSDPGPVKGETTINDDSSTEKQENSKTKTKSLTPKSEKAAPAKPQTIGDPTEFLAAKGLVEKSGVWVLHKEDSLDSAFASFKTHKKNVFTKMKAISPEDRKKVMILIKRVEAKQTAVEIQGKAISWGSIGFPKDIDHYNTVTIPELRKYVDQVNQEIHAVAKADQETYQAWDAAALALGEADRQLASIAQRYQALRANSLVAKALTMSGTQLAPKDQLKTAHKSKEKLRIDLHKLKAQIEKNVGLPRNELPEPPRPTKSCEALDNNPKPTGDMDPAINPVGYLQARGLVLRGKQWSMACEQQVVDDLKYVQRIEGVIRSTKKSILPKFRKAANQKSIKSKAWTQQLQKEFKTITTSQGQQLLDWQQKKIKQLTFTHQADLVQKKINETDRKVDKLQNKRTDLLANAEDRAVTIADHYVNLIDDEHIAAALEKMGTTLGPSRQFQSLIEKIRQKKKRRG